MGQGSSATHHIVGINELADGVIVVREDGRVLVGGQILDPVGQMRHLHTRIPPCSVLH